MTGPLRDQRIALEAYKAVEFLPPSERKDRSIAVNDLAANILRNGLSAALAALEREKAGRGGWVLRHLAQAGIPPVGSVSREELPTRVRELDVAGYMLATRETLRVATWLKRAFQAHDAEG